MDDEVRHQLVQLIRTYGTALCDDPSRCKSLLRDYCPQQKREVNVLLRALEERIPQDILKHSHAIGLEIRLRQLARRLCEHHGLNETPAQWAVNSWALALGSITADKIQALETSQPHASSAPAATAETIVIPQPKLRPGQRPAWQPEMIEIPAGPFLMGSSDQDKMAFSYEKPQHRLQLPTYFISQTPITNAQFRPFVEGDGYTNSTYWTTKGWQWRQHEKRVQPYNWEDANWNGADYPVVGVSWFEAVAYCRWLSAQTGREYRLPSEPEWEKAARGAAGRIWPWGNQWQANRCNSIEAGNDRTTPVGSYPHGASPYGVLDMAGNAWEWCATHWRKDYPYQICDEWSIEYLEQRGPDDWTVLRGGAYWRSKEGVRGDYRYYDYARYNGHFHLVGIRLAGAIDVFACRCA
ncbi:MAG: formylglycine-generating enzyme family protein [Chloroflexaceae bacterium]|nr:formylglycine-generating enzyme family protein [Chloroflexaceae bacterium]